MSLRETICLLLVLTFLVSCSDQDLIESLQENISSYNEELSRKGIDLVKCQSELNRSRVELNKTNTSLVECTVDQDYLFYNSLHPPYINIEGRNVHLVFRDLEGDLIRWKVPFDTLETQLNLGFVNRALISDDDYELVENWYGETSYVLDFRPYVDSSVFEDVVPNLYRKAESETHFIVELWYIVNQLTTYSSEIEETPRYPLETFLSGGGDCEDTAILLASLLKAAPTDWTVKLIYMDADNPDKAEEYNHLLVYLKDDVREWYIDTTQSESMEPFGLGVHVDGIYVEV